MESIETTLSFLIEKAMCFTGSQPTFRLSKDKDAVEIVDACSGYLKIIFENKKAMAHLSKGVLSVQLFKH
jgi:hypothetical protein